MRQDNIGFFQNKAHLIGVYQETMKAVIDDHNRHGVSNYDAFQEVFK